MTAKVKCRKCGEAIYEGWVKGIPVLDGSGALAGVTMTDERYCDDCQRDAGNHRREFRTCQRCGEPFSEGFMDGEGSFYACEDCFDAEMNDLYPDGWRADEHEDEPRWEGGYYDAWEPSAGKFVDTGVFWTEF